MSARILKTHCKCGHELETHFDQKHNCLGTFCDCLEYRLYSDPDPPRQTFKAADPVEEIPPTDPSPAWVDDLVDYDVDDAGPITLPMPWPWP